MKKKEKYLSSLCPFKTAVLLASLTRTVKKSYSMTMTFGLNFQKDTHKHMFVFS